MIYTNDESDKSTRQRNYYVTVYLVPVVLVVMLCGLVYWALVNNYFNQTDAAYACIMSITPAILLSGFNRRHWLKMPDGSFHNIKDVPPTPKTRRNEPIQYTAAYVYSQTEKATTMATGFALVCLSVWLGFKSSVTILIPVFTSIIGLYLSYFGLKGLLDKSAQLQIAENGLWTKKLGFVHWDDVNVAEVKEDKRGRTTQLYLHIRLKGTKFEEANQPDEQLLLSDLKDKEMVEVVINNSINNYNRQKK